MSITSKCNLMILKSSNKSTLDSLIMSVLIIKKN